MSVDLIQPSEEAECCFCSSENVLLYKFESGYPVKKHQHCEFCYCTFAGSRCGLPLYSGEYTNIMCHINQVANLLVARILGAKP